MSNYTPPMVIGHRGSMGTHVENTIPSFQEAIGAGAEAIELDVRVCASGELVVMHDGSLSHLAGVDANVSDVDWHELAAMRLQDPAVPGQTGYLCLLDHLLDDPTIAQALANALLLCIEIKAREAADIAAEWIRQNRLAANAIVYSFHPEDLEVAKRVLPEVRTNFLFGERREEAIETAIGIDAWSLNPETHDADAEFVSEAKARGLHVSAGNAIETADLHRMLRLDVWGVHSNFAARAVAERDLLFA